MTSTSNWASMVRNVTYMMSGLIALGASMSVTYAAGFDCKKAQSGVEIKICADSGLSALDDELKRSYRALLSASKRKGQLQQQQRQWLEIRDQCQDVKCIHDAYRTRLDELSPTLHASIPESGRRIKDFVPDGCRVFETITADFNGDGLRDIALVLSGPDGTTGPRPLVILFKQADGSYKLSARSDKLAPEPYSLGIKNPNATGVLEVKGTMLIVNHSGGEGMSGFANGYGFKFKNNDWYLVATWASGYSADLDCRDLGTLKTDKESCTWHGTHVDLELDRKTESWAILDDQTGKEIKKEKVMAIPHQELKRLIEVQL